MAAKKPAKTEKAAPVTGAQEEKLKALEHALADLDKQFGKGAVMKLGEHAEQNVQVIPTGCLTLDEALGVGGIPRGRIVEIFGPESSGKTTVALHIVAQAQKMGGIAAFVDAEHALDPVYAKNLGVNIDDLYVSQPDTGEQALEIVEALVRSGALDVIVIDSVAALVPKAEIDGEMGDSFVGLQARLMSQALRKLAGIINKTGCVAVFINQLREKVGVMYGNPETTPGGRALKFYASVRLDVRRGEQLKNGSEVVGNHTKVKVVKNKGAPPFRVAAAKVRCWTWRSSATSSTRAARGSATRISASVRAARTRACTCATIPKSRTKSTRLFGRRFLRTSPRSRLHPKKIPASFRMRTRTTLPCWKQTSAMMPVSPRWKKNNPQVIKLVHPCVCGGGFFVAVRFSLQQKRPAAGNELLPMLVGRAHQHDNAA